MGVMLLMGPPGAGKGTVAAGLCGRTGRRHVSTGDLLREAIRAGTALGREAEDVIRRGELVSDGLMVALLEGELAAGGDVLLDGFPRTRAQAELLDQRLAAGGGVERAVLLEAPVEVVLARLGGRRVCGGCGASYHTRFIPPRRDGVCDACGGPLAVRPDDREEAIRRRLAVFEDQMKELRPFYEARGVLLAVDATGTPAETEARILSALGAA